MERWSKAVIIAYVSVLVLFQVAIFLWSEPMEVMIR